MMRFTAGRDEPGPSQWIIVDSRPPGYIGHEIVDLSPGAIELRRVAKELRGVAEQRRNWIDLVELGGDWRRWPGERPDHFRDLSFGLRLIYGVDYDQEKRIFRGDPVRHLAVGGARSRPTPATVGEVASYFWGRRAAQMRIDASGLAHVVVGMNWEQLDPNQLMKLL